MLKPKSSSPLKKATLVYDEAIEKCIRAEEMEKTAKEVLRKFCM